MATCGLCLHPLNTPHPLPCAKRHHLGRRPLERRRNLRRPAPHPNLPRSRRNPVELPSVPAQKPRQRRIRHGVGRHVAARESLVQRREDVADGEGLGEDAGGGVAGAFFGGDVVRCLGGEGVLVG